MEQTNLDRIWATMRENLRPQMTNMSYHAWVEVLIPVALFNDIFVLEAPSADIQKTLRDFYQDMLMDAARKALPSILDVRLILAAEREKYVSATDQTATLQFALNPKYTFDTFVVGSSNHFAHAAALAVAQHPAAAYNPLFIYGGVGLGKTHLMHAIGHSVRQQQPGMRVLYVTSETFTNDLINAIQTDSRLDFRRRYRNADILMIDDVQFIAKKTAVQEEFFNTFNTLYDANKQIVISSDRPPKEITNLEERLRSRFEWGLIADMQPPEVETRIAILRARARADEIEVSDDVIGFIAEHVHSNIRELEGCLTTVVAYASFHHKPLTMSAAAEALKDILPETRRREVTPQLIKETVADFYGISADSLNSARRDREILMPRQIAMYFCHSILGMPYLRISALFDRNDHTTSINACRKISELLETDDAFKASMRDLASRLEK